MAISLKLTNRSPKQPIKKLPVSIEISENATVEETKKKIARQAGVSDFNRIGLYDPATKTILKNRLAVLREQKGVLDNGELLVKDLGPQMAWRTVFMVEYFGPLLFHPAILLLRPYLYKTSSSDDLSVAQQLTFAMVMLHFLKREVETMFVHKFSASTMPAWNIFRNSFFYWAVAGLLAALEVYAPWSFAAKSDSAGLDALGLALFIFGEISNASVHLHLASLRSPGGTERQIPRAFGNSLVTCPNYMFEVIAWVGVIIVSRSPSVALFISVGSYYMKTWGNQKERAYRKEFGDKYKKKRYVMLPGLL